MPCQLVGVQSRGWTGGVGGRAAENAERWPLSGVVTSLPERAGGAEEARVTLGLLVLSLWCLKALQAGDWLR